MVLWTAFSKPSIGCDVLEASGARRVVSYRGYADYRENRGTTLQNPIHFTTRCGQGRFDSPLGGYFHEPHIDVLEGRKLVHEDNGVLMPGMVLPPAGGRYDCTYRKQQLEPRYRFPRACTEWGGEQLKSSTRHHWD